MIREMEGDLLGADVDALVNAVNTVGVMGKGLALQFKRAFPANFEAYRRACAAGEVRLGRMLVAATGLSSPRLIVNFPTKGHWRSPSRLEDVASGLEDLVRTVEREGIGSIAVPPLGCGLGGLRWEEVRPLVVAAFAPLPGVEVRLYPPR